MSDHRTFYEIERMKKGKYRFCQSSELEGLTNLGWRLVGLFSDDQALLYWGHEATSFESLQKSLEELQEAFEQLSSTNQLLQDESKKLSRINELISVRTLPDWMADLLLPHGYKTFGEIAYASYSDLLQINKLGPSTLRKIANRLLGFYVCPNWMEEIEKDGEWP